MVQTNNQPQAADFGSIFPSVGVSAYGARNRRQRGVYNIKFWSSFRPKTTVGPNTGRSVTAVRGSAWNVIGTSAHSILIDNVTSASQSLSHATTAENAANAARTIAFDDIMLARTTAIDDIILARTAMRDYIPPDNDQHGKLSEILNSIQLRLFDLTSSSNLSINDIIDYNAIIQNGTTQISMSLGTLEDTFAIPIEVETANASTSTAITADANFTATVANEIAKHNAMSAAQTALNIANSRLY